MKLSPFLLSLALPLIPSVASAEILSVKTQSANFREQPSDKGSIVYSADKFYPVEVIERKNGWALVRDFEGDKAWVVEHALAKQTTVVISTDHANIREKASTDSEVLFKVEHGEVFKVQEHKDHWIKVVDAHGDGGWVRADMTWGIDGEKPKADADKPKADSEKSKADSEKPSSKGEPKVASEEKAKSEKSEKSKADKPKAEEAKASSPKGDDDHCTCHKADEDKAQKKVDLTERQTADKGEKSDKKQKGDAKGESKAKTADDKSDHAKPGHAEHAKPESKGSEHHAKPEHDKAAHDKPVHAKPEHDKAAHDKPVHAKPEHDKAANPAHAKPEPKSHAKPEPKKPA